ncbi:hypothetical protein OCU04_004625 [Sclerotinia nivalis]|uniref:Uncharacterized protein n=1 Tax=Sclerotinia nivalis TaxID=352851 RepID=A0A9X0DNQ1_9HELO|nr:hypothetical protein OCU04_004625 [Sclerotinia nivalis]
MENSQLPFDSGSNASRRDIIPSIPSEQGVHETCEPALSSHTAHRSLHEIEDRSNAGTILVPDSMPEPTPPTAFPKLRELPLVLRKMI